MVHHYEDCPAAEGQGGICTCEGIEDAIVAQASRPSPAELIRRAKAKGLIQPKQAYA
jgi:hypothetical protein